MSTESGDSPTGCMPEDSRYSEQSYVDAYAGLWAFGYANGLGQAEGLYRGIASLAFERQPREKCKLVLDFGCGPGRLSATMAQFYREAQVIGLDRSQMMVDIAKAIVCDSGEPLSLDLSHLGFGTCMLPRLGIPNAKFVCHSDELFRSRWRANTKSRFDVIVAANVLDRVACPVDDVNTLRELLAPGGILVGSCPLNWRSAEQWASINSASDLACLFEEAGFVVDFMVDGFVYRELLDARGSSADYRTCLFRLTDQ